MKNKSFAIDIAKYFMDFLETDFHKRRIPKRACKSINEKNLLVGINLKSFSNFKKKILKSACENFKKSEHRNLKIKKGIHTISISPFISDIVQEYCKSLKQEELDKVDKEVKDLSKELINKITSNPEEAKDQILKISQDTVFQQIINPLTKKIANSLQKNFNLSDIENDLYDLFYESIERLVHEFVVKDNPYKKDTTLDISSILSLKMIRSEIQNYFDKLKITDLFLQVKELLNNRKIIDKQELYVYLYDIKFEKITYPLFYIPVEIEKTNPETINLKVDSSIYINKKAIEYVIQKINESEQRKGKITGADERIIYLNEDNIESTLENLFNEILNYSQIDGKFNVCDIREQVFKSNNIFLTNNCYLALFDKSDEALINDYEELINLLSNDSDIGEKFCDLLEGFLKKEPDIIIDKIESEWQDIETSKKLTPVSPIPLNEEQSQITMAIQKGAKYIAVEGPPGTGKSHTITAIVFQAILENKNVLVLSDKKEALDVVEDKITKTLNKVRWKDDFQNPILRLGKAGNTYNKIFSQSAILKIRDHYKSVQKYEAKLKEEINKTKNGLKEIIDDEIKQHSEIKLNEIKKLEKLEDNFNRENLLKIDEEELFFETDIINELKKIRDIGIYISSNNFSSLRTFCKNTLKDPQETKSFLQLEKLIKIVYNLKKELYYSPYYSNDPKPSLKLVAFQKIEGISSQNVDKLISISNQVETLGSGFFSYFFKYKALKKLHYDLTVYFQCPYIENLKSKKNRDKLKGAVDIVRLFGNKQSEIDWTVFTRDKYEILKKSLNLNIDKISKISGGLRLVEEFIKMFPKTAKNLNLKKGVDICSFLYLKDLKKVIDFYSLKKKITISFKNLVQYDYVKNRTESEDLYKIQMTHVLDKRVINFYDHSPAKVQTLKGIIKSKKKFPKEEFEHLKSAFPCIISGIRDYAEYIPLSDKLFDIVIIDEASQVSIAQALPSMLRAKTTIVFGDKKQFSNIKSSHARSTINKQHINDIKDNYTSEKNIGVSELERLSKFNIKTSVLEFFDYIRNYSIMLKKHFRGYRELISYSSKNFYNDELQAIKIRSKPIEQVLEFRFIDHDGKLDKTENTNLLEIDEVIKYLESVMDIPNAPSIGIITPHTNQQKMLFNKINEHDRCNDFYENNNLKIMTFDTCQGEERDHVLYSMVAHSKSDKLNYVFIKDFKTIDIEEDSKIKAQRLNVGFSRAKEKMVFICSKELNQFTGEISNALKHYSSIIKKSKARPTSEDVDKKSPMEKKVLDWLQETTFYKENQPKLELKAQFKIGEYLKQLDPLYNHPKYTCDFLLVYSNSGDSITKIIIEYDGFKEHFVDLEDVNEYNYEQYRKEKDIYKDKVLEGYGYKILRINKFNLGKKPIEILDKRLRLLVKSSNNDGQSTFIDKIQNTFSRLEQGALKECLKCHKLLPIKDFKDSSLLKGIGRYCKTCKYLRRKDDTY